MKTPALPPPSPPSSTTIRLWQRDIKCWPLLVFSVWPSGGPISCMIQPICCHGASGSHDHSVQVVYVSSAYSFFLHKFIWSLTKPTCDYVDSFVQLLNPIFIHNLHHSTQLQNDNKPVATQWQQLGLRCICGPQSPICFPLSSILIYILVHCKYLQVLCIHQCCLLSLTVSPSLSP